MHDSEVESGSKFEVSWKPGKEIRLKIPKIVLHILLYLNASRRFHTLPLKVSVAPSNTFDPDVRHFLSNPEPPFKLVHLS